MTSGDARGPDDAAAAEFEARRLAYFAGQGVALETRRLDGSAGQTYVSTTGAGSPLRLLIHGGLSEASEWGLLAGPLGGRQAIPDRPGWGLSYRIDYRRVADYRAAAAAWVGEVVDGLGEDDVDLIANSMGGYFAIAFALEHPERVRRLVLLGAPAGVARSLPMFLRLWGNPIASHLVRRLAPRDPEELRDRALSALVAHPELLPDEYLELAFLGARLPGADVASSTMLRSVTDLRGWRSDLLVDDAMAELRVPTLFAWGEQDGFLAPSVGEALAAGMPDAELVTISDAGHMPQLDQPGRVAAVVNEFLEGD